MSLRAFHIVFIVVTIVLSVFVTVWGVTEFVQERNALGLGLALLFMATAAVLVVYGKKVFVKLRDLQ
ncbi:MAG TPA: hypothetical protein VF701_00630 [Thermoanaerobaculia bacterium]